MNDGEGLSRSLAHYISACDDKFALSLRGGCMVGENAVQPRCCHGGGVWCSNLLEINVNPETDTRISTVEGYNYNDV